MTWIVAAVSVPCALLVGALVGAWSTRRRFKRSPGAFRCKLRIDTGRRHVIKKRWPRRVSYALWLHDVLVVLGGALVARPRMFAVRFAEGSEEPADRHEVRGLGGAPVQLTLLLDDGATAVLAGAAEARELVAGPFIVAQLPMSGRSA